MWTLPLLLLGVTIAMSIPLSKYFMSVMEGRFAGLKWLGWFDD